MTEKSSMPGGMAVAGCNYVGQDQIWKDHVTQEMAAAKSWPENWKFLTQDYKELVKDDFPPCGDKKTTVSPHELMLSTKVIPLEELVTVHPSSKPVPKTTAAMIGWRSSEPKHKLDKYGGYARPKYGIEKQLNWPMEAID